MAAIADIQITPPVLKLDPATRTGRFSVTVANQLGREGHLEVSLIPVGDTKEEWLRLEERYKTLSLKKDETTVFDVAVSVPPGVAPGTYGFKLRCADALDPANVKVDSEQRDLVVAARTAASPPPPTASRLRWVLLGAGALIVIGGGIALALVLTRPKCDPACKVGFVCHGGTCEAESTPVVDAATTHKADASRSHPDAACVEGAGRPCGQCNGSLSCEGVCSAPTPDKFGQKCNECGGTIGCKGCAPAAPANFGASCDPCGGTFGCSGCMRKAPANFGARCNECGGTVQCNGSCSPPLPSDLHQVKEKVHVRTTAVGEQSFGGACDPGFEIAEVTVRSLTGVTPCRLVSQGSKRNCTARVALSIGFPIPSSCEIIIRERRVCDQAGLTEIRDHRDVPRVNP